MKKSRKQTKKWSKKVNALLDPTKFLKHAGMAAFTGCMVGALVAILRNAF